MFTFPNKGCLKKALAFKSFMVLTFALASSTWDIRSFFKITSGGFTCLGALAFPLGNVPKIKNTLPKKLKFFYIHWGQKIVTP